MSDPIATTTPVAPDTSATVASPAAAPQSDNAAAPAASTPQPSLDDKLAAALDQGIAQADGKPAANTEPPRPVESATQAPQPAASATPAQAAEVAKKSAEDKADVEAEITSLNLKDKSAARFREMSSEIRDMRPLKEAIEKAGIKDVTQLPKLVQRAQAADAWEQEVFSTKANPEQMGMAFDYLRLVNEATPTALRKAYEMMQREQQAVAKLLGIEAPGVYDPLADNPDLKQMVEAGDMTRPAALEVAAARQQQKIATAHADVNARESANANAQQAGRQQLNTLGEQLRASDPDYPRKYPYLVPIVRRICATLPPNRWLAEVQAAYQEIPTPPAAAPELPPVGRVPPRAAAVPPANLAKQTNDPMEALEMGIALANAQ